MKKKEIRQKYLQAKESDVGKFRKEWIKKGYDLVNITTLCEPKMGYSGWCNDFNEPDETCHHIQLRYREEIVANLMGNKMYVIDDSKYVIFLTDDDHTGKDFIIFKKVKIEEEQ